MAVVARRSGVTVAIGSIEEWDANDRHFDLLTAGQAWHWVHPHRGAATAATVLRPGGRIGLFWNQAEPDSSIRPTLAAAYARYAPKLGRESVLMGQRDASLYESIAEALRRTHEFDDVAIELFGHDVIYSCQEWVDLAGTHSDHRALPPDQREGLLAQMRTEIDRAGGRVPVHYEATLVMGLRR
jgi:SAM-dependent methyltransferase